MTHPLTDDIIESELATPAHFTSGSLVGLFTHDDLRDAADWQLDRDAEYFAEYLVNIFGFDPEIAQLRAETFKKAMRQHEVLPRGNAL